MAFIETCLRNVWFLKIEGLLPYMDVKSHEGRRIVCLGWASWKLCFHSFYERFTRAGSRQSTHPLWRKQPWENVKLDLHPRQPWWHRMNSGPQLSAALPIWLWITRLHLPHQPPCGAAGPTSVWPPPFSDYDLTPTLRPRLQGSKVTSPMTTTIRIPPYSKCSTILQTFFSDRT
jgi:hypothetical protein